MIEASIALAVGLGSLAAAMPIAFVGRRGAHGALLVGSASLLLAGLLVWARGPIDLGAWVGPLGEAEFLRVDTLSSYYLVLLGAVGCATSLFAFGDDPGPRRALSVGSAATLLGAALVFVSPTSVLFLTAWEVMTLGVFLALREGGRPHSALLSPAYTFLVLGEGSAIAWMIAFAGLHVARGNWILSGSPLAGGMASGIFVAGVVAAGIKMGVTPFQIGEWFPIARGSAPPVASALLTGVVATAGTYGLFRIVAVVGVGPVWWGVLLLVVGTASAFLGALWASVSENPRGLLAYSTVEANGLVMVAVGTFFMARFYDLPSLAELALFAALFQVAAQATAKAGLFLFVGHLTRHSPTPALDGDRFPRHRAGLPSVGAYLGGLSLAAAPPLAGFVSEWMILEALFQSFRFPSFLAELVGLGAGAILALAAGLMVVAMTKFVGYGALWRSLPPHGSRREVPDGLAIVGMTGLAAALGVVAPWLLTALAPVASQAGGVAATAPIGTALALPTGWTIFSGAPFGAITPPGVIVALGIGALVALGYFALGGPPRFRRTATWIGGNPGQEPWEAYGSYAFSTVVRVMLSDLLPGPDGSASALATPGRKADGEHPLHREGIDPFESIYRGLYRGVFSFVGIVSRVLMPGRLDLYVAYLLAAVLAVILYVGILYH